MAARRAREVASLTQTQRRATGTNHRPRSGRERDFTSGRAIAHTRPTETWDRSRERSGIITQARGTAVARMVVVAKESVMDRTFNSAAGRTLVLAAAPLLALVLTGCPIDGGHDDD